MATGAWNLTALHLQTPVGLVGLSGWVGRDSLAVAAELPALELSNLVPDLSAAGGGYLRIGGTLAKPEAQGMVTLEEIRLDTLALGNARLRLALADSLLAEFSADAGVRLALTCPAAPLFGPEEAPRSSQSRRWRPTWGRYSLMLWDIRYTGGSTSPGT